jgi:FMN-dependent NADH-azoreductase
MIDIIASNHSSIDLLIVLGFFGMKNATTIVSEGLKEWTTIL